MYKRLFTLALAVLSGVTFAAAQSDIFAEFTDAADTDTLDTQVEDQGPVRKGAHPWRQEEGVEIADGWSNWSLLLDAGANFFDGDYHSEKRSAVGYPTVGLTAEYTFTPQWSLGLGYSFAMPRIQGKTGDGLYNANVLLEQYLHRVNAYLSFDLMSACFSKWNKKIFGTNIMAGGGVGFFRNTTYYPLMEYENADVVRGHTAMFEPMSMDKYEFCPFILVGLNVEFNLSRSIALGAKCTYTYFMQDDLEGVGPTLVASKNNDGVCDLTVSLRYKIQAVKMTHIKNVNSVGVLADLQDMYNGKEEVPHVVDTLYVITRDTLVMQQTLVRKDTMVVNNTVQQEKSEDNYYFIYFDSGKASLKEEGLMIIQQIASRMNREKDMCAEIIGYCDNVGSDAVNLALAQTRAKSVTDELIEEYEIDPERMVTLGRGKIVGSKRGSSAYGPNRRAEVRLVRRSEFERLKKEYKEDAQKFNKFEDQQQQKVREEKHLPVGTLDKVESSQNMTLSKLARRYYKNTFCWVYIYQANMDVLSSPNDLEPGMNLVIPELTDEQKKITKEKSLELYNELKQKQH